MSVNDKQVDGTHYRAKTQHWDLVEFYGLGYLEGCATKYVARSRKKHKSPVTDLDKAIHYCEKLQNLHLSGKRNNRANRNLSYKTFVDFRVENELTPEEIAVVSTLMFWKEASDIQDAIEILVRMKDKAIAEES